MLGLTALATALAAPRDAQHPRLSGPLREAHRLAWDRPDELERWRAARRGPNDVEGLSVVIGGQRRAASVAFDAGRRVPMSAPEVGWLSTMSLLTVSPLLGAE